MNSTDIRVGSSEKLSVDKIYLPLVHIDAGAEQLNHLYSINLRQYALSHEAYLFYDRIKRTRSSLVPFSMPSHRSCRAISTALTIQLKQWWGLWRFSEEQQKRIFISNKDVPDWGYKTLCTLFTIDNDPDSISRHATGLTTIRRLSGDCRYHLLCC